MAAPDDRRIELDVPLDVDEVRENYRRIELDFTLDVDEVREIMLTGSGGNLLFEFKRSPKMTNGVVDKPGRHYSAHNWVCSVRLPNGKSRVVTIGITDYEHFGSSSSQKKASRRRQDHRHFWVGGSPAAVEQVPESLKGAMTRGGRRIW